MKVLTAAQMREVDRRTIELGVPGIVLMENAGHRVVEFLEEKFAPLRDQRIVVLCGKGNNGGDGMVIARQLHTRIRPRALDVVLAGEPADLKGDALANYRMLAACRCPVQNEITPGMRMATLVIDALLGTGIRGAATGRTLDLIREINTHFPLAEVVAVDIPSGLDSDAASNEGEFARANYTVTFTAPKVAQVLPPNCTRVGELRVGPIGSPPELYENDPAVFLSLVVPEQLRPLFRPRDPLAHKGSFGHVLVVAGSRGKAGAAAMAGMAALRAGAGLVTVASVASAIPVIAAQSPELMTEPLDEAADGTIARSALDRILQLAASRDLVALGPGIGTQPDTVDLVRALFAQAPQPMVVDADGLNSLAGSNFSGSGHIRVLTPHPGEMARLTGRSTSQVQSDRVGAARCFAMERDATVVLKGYRTLVAYPDGRVWVNPTGSPAMATGGTGDILTGMISGLLAQFPSEFDTAIAAAVYLHGLAGELGAAELGEKALIATDLLQFLPEAMDALVPYQV
jgi:ADP-dependent NAD(P)H-hydrate dehydratase / NAD(P)H-hydrate epimerase